MSNSRATCARPGVDQDLANVVQKKGESLQEFIHHFCNKRNIISEVDDKSIIMFFKKGLRGSSFINKLAMKNPRMSKEMLAIANKSALAEEAILDMRDQKKDKELGHSNQPSTSRSHNKKRKADRSVANVERLRRNKDYQPRPGEFEGFLDQICIFHPQGKHKIQECDRLQCFTNEALKMAKKVD
jgi:hypothetical protein